MSRITRWVLWISGILVALVLAAMAIGPAAWGWAMRAQPTIPTHGDAEDTEPYTPPTTAVKDRVLVLILGVEGRGELAADSPPGKNQSTGVRSDTLLLAAMDPERRTLGLVSIPRDTWAYLTGRGYDKITHAYAYGGHELSMKAVSQLFDLPINHYVVVNWDGFEQIVDAAGGVEIDVEKRMYYADPYQDLVIDLQPGLQVLDGDHALQYARFRSDAESDWGRMRRQQTVIRAVLDKATQPSSALRIPALVRSLFGAVRTDLSLSQTLQFANVGRDLARDEPLQTTVLPGTDQYLNGVYYTLVDVQEIRAAAYRTLLGQDPPSDYVARAEEDAAKYKAAAATAIEKERERRAAQQAEQPGETDGQPEDGAGEPDSGWLFPDGQQPPPDGPDGQTGGAGQPGAGQGDGTGEPPAGPQSPPGSTTTPGEDGTILEPLPPGITVSVVDASGRDVLAAYVLLLRRHGFDVTQVGTSAAVEEKTLVRDASGSAKVALQLQAVLPWALWEPGAPGRPAMVEIRLGQDTPQAGGR